MSSKLKEVISAYGHENVLATHKTTLEITKEKKLTKKGNCIIAVSANKSINDLSNEFKNHLRKKDSKIKILIEAGTLSETINASGDLHLILNHPTDMVIRKSAHVCNRTLAVQADKAACNLPRDIVEKLKNPKQKVKITLLIET